MKSMKSRKMKSRHYRYTKRGGIGFFDAAKNAADAAKNAAAATASKAGVVSASLARSAKSVSKTILDGGGRLSQLNLIMLAFTPNEFRKMKDGIVRMGGGESTEQRFKTLVNMDRNADTTNSVDSATNADTANSVINADNSKVDDNIVYKGVLDKDKNSSNTVVDQ